METTSGELTDFCVTLTPDDEAVARAGHAIQQRFTFIAEQTRIDLLTAVAERVQKLVARGSGRQIAVMIAVEPDALHGEVTDDDEPSGRNGARFEIPNS